MEIPHRYLRLLPADNLQSLSGAVGQGEKRAQVAAQVAVTACLLPGRGATLGLTEK